MKKTLLLFLTLIICHYSFSQSWRRVGSWGNELTDIHWVNDDVAYISGDQIILKTVDGGENWVEQEAPLDAKMLTLDFFDHNNGLMVGEGGLIFKTSDGGNSWTIVTSGVSENFYSVKFISQNKVLVAGEAGQLLVSENGGNTWTKQSLGTTASLNSIYFVNADSGYIATSAAKILKTTNGGASWQSISTPVSFRLNDVHFSNDTTGYTVGDNGTILKTIDAGLSWAYIQSGTNYDYHRVAFNESNANIGIIGGEGGIVLYTNNAGLTFVERTSRTTEDIAGIDYKLSSNTVFAVANSGVLISSTNSGSSWSLRMSGRNNHFSAIDFVTDVRGYIAGEEALVLLTTNGGTSFTDRSRPLDVDFHDIEFETAAFGYVVGDGGTILNTTNSGGSWTALNPNTEKNLYGLHFFDTDVGYIVGEGGYIAKTENRGVNWETIQEGTGSVNFKDVNFFNNQIGLIIGEQGKLFRTTGNDVWEEVSLTESNDLNSLVVLDEQTALIAGNSGVLYKTSDAGANWEKLNTNFNSDFKGIDFLDGEVGFIVGDKGLIIQTMDQGLSWEEVSTNTFQDFKAISFGDVNTGYAVGENGIFYQYSCLLPEATSDIFGLDNICMSQQIYTVQDEAVGDLSFEWRVDGGQILEGQGSNRIIVEWNTPGRNAVLVQGQNVCGKGPTTALEVLVSEEPKQLVEVIGDGVACYGSTQPFEVDSVAGTEYVWEVTGGAIQSGQGTAHITVDWTELGEQHLTVFARNACGQGPDLNKSITVIQSPEQPGVIQGSVQVGLVEEAYEVPAVSGINYQWETGGGGNIISGQGTNSVVVSWEKEGDFELKVTPMNACNEGQSQSLNVNVNLITAIENEEENTIVKIYPNPSEGDIHISVKGVGNIKEIRVMNSFGQSLQKITPGLGIFDFDIQNLPKGVLFVVVESSAGKTVDKVWIK
ncbi:YCF48-related protein [Echinicola sp. 20G]|uniref:YCF48-related protein n=1 Tax=Echinicola sp. 20G TaxID=2781961 RepID=UPI00190FFC36|nr:YCF48-related protein [Echinicola sp. 20G]